MSNKSVSKCSLCRRAGEKLFLKGDRCLTPKCAMTRRPYAPGVHGQVKKRGLSEYGRQLAEKQKLRRTYGVSEGQFRKHLEESRKQSGVVGENLVQRLEMRLDNLVYRSGFAFSRAQARQLVNHGMFLVNGVKLDIPSAKIGLGDEITLKENKAGKKFFMDLKAILKKSSNKLPEWLAIDVDKVSSKILSKPNSSQLNLGIDIAIVIEFYSRS